MKRSIYFFVISSQIIVKRLINNYQLLQKFLGGKNPSINLHMRSTYMADTYICESWLSFSLVLRIIIPL